MSGRFKPLKSEKSALIVLDMQEHFREYAEPLIPQLQRLFSNLKEKHVPIIFTQHGHINPAVDGGMLNEWWDEHIIEGTNDWKLMKEITMGPGMDQNTIILKKKKYSAFIDTSLERQLRQLHIDTVIIAGTMTNLCCETTARDAFNLGFRVFFLSDGTATSGPQFQQATLLNLGFGFATICTCDDVIQSIE